MISTSSIDAVVKRHLCTGCGACAGMAPQLFRMSDNAATGRRPVAIATGNDTAAAEDAFAVCPGAGSAGRPTPLAPQGTQPGVPSPVEWGTVLEIWEGHAADADIRWRGSSGGVVTALAVFAIENAVADGAVHVSQSKDNALLNESVISRSREELLAGAGSRYSPASPCERLAEVASGQEAMVFIGKPCDVQATAVAAGRHADLARNIALSISIFCAGTPSTNGTRALVAALGVPPGARVTSLRYRGDGWPGTMAAEYVTSDGEQRISNELTYGEGWGGILQKHRQWRCHLCADHTGEFADLSIGDPWDRPRLQGKEAGSSLIVVRTLRGRDILRRAIAAGVVVASPRELGALASAQPNLSRTRRIMYGRLLALRLLGLGAPEYTGWKLGSLWISHTGFRDKVGSVLGTMRRALRRGLWRNEERSGGPR